VRPLRREQSGFAVIAALLAASLLLTGCSGAPEPGLRSSPASTPTARVSRDLAVGLQVPWDLAVLPGGDILVTLRERAEVVRVDGAGATQVAARIDEVAPAGEGGLLGIALSPRFASDRLVYLYYSVARENRVVRFTYTGTGLTDPTPIVTGIPRAGNHNGGRLRFGPDGYLYIGTGDAGLGENAQDRNSLGGKILRVAADGSIPADNPFGNAVYSYGHRNVQGLGWDGSGRLYASEFGQDTFDELNLIRAGGNYGWPLVEGMSQQPDLVSPLLVWRPVDASPSGIAVSRSGTVYIAALRGQRVWTTSPAGAGMTQPTVFLDGLGRIRDVEIVGENLLVLTNNTARGTPRSGDDRLVSVPLA